VRIFRLPIHGTTTVRTREAMTDPTLAAAAEDGFRLALVATAFVFGLRHGIDWDHIAAITDITSSQTNSRSAMRFASLYAAGHALVVLLLGLLAIEVGTRLPAGIDAVMERFVGLSLLLLGAYVFYALIRHGRDFRMRSRWMLVFSGIRRVSLALRRRRAAAETPVVIVHEHEHDHEHPLHASHEHHDAPAPGAGRLAIRVRVHGHAHRHSGALPPDPFAEYGTATSLAVGALHGVGAETPTQVLLFLSAVGAGGRVAGAVLLVTFLIGLFTSNTLVALASTYGYLNANRHFPVYAAVAVTTGLFSLLVGALFLFGRGTLLPALLGG
jgi:ABC-type nickel/cobalt efflux system permease component RcnA